MSSQPEEFDDGFDDVILLGIEGNCAYALHGKTFESGESEFVELNSEHPRWSEKWIKSAKHKAIQAGTTLAKRLGIPRRFGFDENLNPDGAH